MNMLSLTERVDLHARGKISNSSKFSLQNPHIGLKSLTADHIHITGESQAASAVAVLQGIFECAELVVCQLSMDATLLTLNFQIELKHHSVTLTTWSFVTKNLMVPKRKALITLKCTAVATKSLCLLFVRLMKSKIT